MSLPLRLLMAFASTLLACAPALAQEPVAPEPRKSKPGSVKSLIDDLTDYGFSQKRAFEPLGEKERGEAAYRKLVEMGFDAVPALLDAIKDKRLTRRLHFKQSGFGFAGPQTYAIRTQVGQVVGEILNDLAGRELSTDVDAPWLDEQKVREWWKKAQKEGEEKWLAAHLSAERMPGGSFTPPPANKVIFRALGAKYPARLAEFYQTVLRKQPEQETRELADEVAACKLPRAEKLALLAEGAEHNRLVHRNAALAVLAKFDPATFRKHLLATLKKLPPDVEGWWHPQAELAALVWKTDDPACWDALSALARRSSVETRIEIIRTFSWPDLNGDKATRRELLRFLSGFLSDASFDGEPTSGIVNPNLGTPDPAPERVQDVAALVLAGQLGIKTEYDVWRGPVSCLFIRAAVAKAAAEELARLKK